VPAQCRPPAIGSHGLYLYEAKRLARMAGRQHKQVREWYSVDRSASGTSPSHPILSLTPVCTANAFHASPSVRCQHEQAGWNMGSARINVSSPCSTGAAPRTGARPYRAQRPVARHPDTATPRERVLPWKEVLEAGQGDPVRDKSYLGLVIAQVDAFLHGWAADDDSINITQNACQQWLVEAQNARLAYDITVIGQNRCLATTQRPLADLPNRVREVQVNDIRRLCSSCQGSARLRG